MIRSLNTAEKAMQVLQVKMDALANNLANAGSTGFRQVLTQVTEKANGPQSPTGAVATNTGISASSLGTQLKMNHVLDPRPGPINATGRDTDFALMGRGFFVIGSESGERYTRNGSFVLDGKQQLITPGGDPVQGEGGPIILTNNDFNVEADGTIVSDGNVVGKLKIVDFKDPSQLEHQGANLLKPPKGMSAEPVPPAEVAVAQGHLEGSNVNPIDTLVAMIEAQRAFEIQGKIMMTEDELLSKSVNNLPRVSG